MKDIKDYFGTKTAIKCENEKQWNKLKELCGDRLEFDSEYSKKHPYFNLYIIGCKNTKAEFIQINGKILPYSDFVSDVPELVGVEMEVSDSNENWSKDIVLGKYNGFYIASDGGTWKHARPITKKVLTATLQELAEMLNVDEIQLK